MGPSGMGKTGSRSAGDDLASHVVAALGAWSHTALRCVYNLSPFLFLLFVLLCDTWGVFPHTHSLLHTSAPILFFLLLLLFM